MSEEEYHEGIGKFATGLLGKNTVNEIIWYVTNYITSHLKFEDCVIYLVDEKNEYLVKKAAIDNNQISDNKAKSKINKIKIGQGIVGKAALLREAKIINDTSKDKNYIVDEKIRLSEIAVPLIHKEVLIGVIDSEHSDKNYFTQSHINLLTRIASIATKKMAQAIRLEKIYTRQFHMDLIYNSTNDLIFLIAVEPNDVFRCVSANQAYLDTIGLSKSDVVGKTIDEIWKGEKRTFFSTQYKTAIASKSPFTYEVTYPHKKPPIIVETTITPIFDDHGNCLNISGISRDITKNKKAEEAIRESKEQFENLFEYSPGAIFIHDFENITHVNQSFLKLFEYKKKEDIIGKATLPTLVFTEDVSLVSESRKKISTGVSNYIPSIRLLKSDGSTFIAETYASVVMLEGKPHTRVSARDITERKQAERILLESEKRYRTLFENSLDGIYKSTPDGKFVDVNPALVKILGYSSEEELLAIDIKTQLYFNVEDRTDTGQSNENHRCVKKKDGSEIWVEDHGNYEYDSRGNVLFHHGIVRDVSGKIEKQKELEKLLSVTANQNKRLQNFAHIVSHNIRSHSANMISLVRFMETSTDEYEKAKLFNMLKTSTDKLEETIKNLNEIITVNQNLEKPKEKRDLYKEVNNTLKVLSGDILQHKISIVVDIPPKVMAHVIPAYLDSILLNVVSNAIKYRSPERDPKIHIEVKKSSNYTILSVTDNGLGIDLVKNADKLFGMYQTFHDNEDSRGFGLYITKNQIEAMDGKIEVISKIKEGSTFKIYFSHEN